MNVEDMLTNIALWFSSKNEGVFIMHEFGGQDDAYVLESKQHNYHQVRTTLKEILTENGSEILGIDYIHSTQSYTVTVRTQGAKSLRYFVISHVPGDKIIGF